MTATLEPTTTASGVKAATGASPADVVRKAKEAGVQVVDLRRSEEHTSELQSRLHLVCRLLLEKKKEYNFVVHSEGRNATTLLIRVGNAGQPAQWVARFSGGLETLGQAIEFLEELCGDYSLNVHPYP